MQAKNLDLVREALSIKGKIDKLDCIKILNYASTRMRRQATEQDKIFANHIPSKRLVSKTYKESLKPNSKRQFNLKMSKRQTFYCRR